MPGDVYKRQAGTDGKTIDGMGMARINALIEKMRDFSYAISGMISLNSA